jgi:hypothetical protein
VVFARAGEFDISMHMWGFPYGVDDDLLVVFESEKGLENYMNFEAFLRAPSLRFS